MARGVFFSFHYERDISRACVVRNSWVTKGEAEGRFIDASLWEEAKRKGADAIRRLIDDGLKNTSVTAVLIGAETASRPWVIYEIEKSMERGNGILGVRIHAIQDLGRRVDPSGPNPLDRVMGWQNGRQVPLSPLLGNARLGHW
jgi:hypothetical protein